MNFAKNILFKRYCILILLSNSALDEKHEWFSTQLQMTHTVYRNTEWVMQYKKVVIAIATVLLTGQEATAKKSLPAYPNCLDGWKNGRGLN